MRVNGRRTTGGIGGSEGGIDAEHERRRTLSSRALVGHIGLVLMLSGLVLAITGLSWRFAIGFAIAVLGAVLVIVSDGTAR